MACPHFLHQPTPAFSSVPASALSALPGWTQHQRLRPGRAAEPDAVPQGACAREWCAALVLSMCAEGGGTRDWVRGIIKGSLRSCMQLHPVSTGWCCEGRGRDLCRSAAADGGAEEEGEQSSGWAKQALRPFFHVRPFVQEKRCCWLGLRPTAPTRIHLGSMRNPSVI